MTLWRLMWPWLRQRWKSLAAALALALLTILAGVGLLTVAGWFLTGAFLAGAGAAFNMFAPSALIRALSFWRIGARWGERVVGHSATLNLLADIRTAVFACLATLSPVQLAKYQEGDLVARLAGDIDSLDTLFLLFIAPLLTAVAGGLLFSVLAGVYVPWLGWLVFAIMMVAACVVPFLLARWSRWPGEQAQLAAAQARIRVHDMVASHVDMAIFDAQTVAAHDFDHAVRRLSSARDRVAAVGASGQFVQQLMVGVCLLALLGMGLLAYQQGRLSGPVWVGLVLGGIGLFEVLGPLMRGAARLGTAIAAARRLQDILDSRPAMVDPEHASSLPAQGDLELHDVSFAWAGASDQPAILRAVDLRIAQGERLAIVGASGSGKSTLLALLMRIMDPDTGRISYGGVDVSAVRMADLRHRFTLLSQHSPAFIGTVRSNLLIGNPQASEGQLWQALSLAKLDDFVQSLDSGLDSWVGEGGRNLSVGQVRRLCLARALLTSATVWVLDEPTAGLDTQAQTAFFNDLQYAAKGRTVIIATHAILPPGTVDRTLILKNGGVCLLNC